MSQQQQKRPPPEWDLLLSAAQKNRPDLITEMIEVKGVDPSHSNAVGQSALHVAALWGHVDAVQALVTLGANVNAQNNLTGATPLHMIIQSNKVKQWDDRINCINILLQGGADAFQADNYGSIPADTVQMNNYTTDEVSELQKILRLNEEIIIPDIYHAVVDLNVETVKSILELKPTDVSIEHDGNTLIGHVVNGMVNCVDECVQEGTKTDDDCEDILAKSQAILKELLSHGANPNTIPKPKKGRRNIDAMDGISSTKQQHLPLNIVIVSLRKAFRTENMKCANILQTTVVSLLDSGATIEDDTNQLLYQVSRFGELSMVIFLTQVLGVNPNTIGPQLMTPLHFAARSGRVDVVKFLLTLPDININATDSRGETALDAARANGRDDIVQVFKTFAEKA